MNDSSTNKESPLSKIKSGNGSKRIVFRDGAPAVTYLLAVGITLAMLFLRIILDSWFGASPALILFVIPILLSAYIGGLGSGLVSTFLTALITNYFIISPKYTFVFDNSVDFIQWIILIAVGILISIFLESSQHSLHWKGQGSQKSYLATKRKIQFGFGVALTCLLLVGVMSFLSINRLSNDSEKVDHTEEVIKSLRLVLSMVTDAESAQRGYVIVGDERFLDPYYKSQQNLDSEINGLKNLISDNSIQQYRVGILAPLVKERMNNLAEVIDLRRSQGFTESQLLIARGEGRELHDRIRQIIGEMEETEQVLLKERVNLSNLSTNFTVTTIIVGNIFAFTFVMVALFVIGKDFAERQLAEESLNQQASLINNANDAIIVWKENGEISFWNNGAERLYGFPNSQAIGRMGNELLKTKTSEGTESIIRALAETDFWEGVLEQRTKEGETIFVESRMVRVHHIQGDYVLESNRDITLRRRAEKELNELNEKLETRVIERTRELEQTNEKVRLSEIRFAGIVNSAMDAIISVDSAQKITLFNQAAEKLFLCPAHDAIGQSIEKFIPKRYHLEHRNHIKEFGANGVTSRYTNSLGILNGIRANGEEFPIEASISQIEVAGEKHFTVILRDITERRKAEEANLLLSSIVESTDDAIIGKTLDGVITSWNRGAERLYGYKSDEVIGKSKTLLLPPDNIQEVEDILKQIRNGQRVSQRETEHIRKDGTRIKVLVMVSPIRNSEGELIGASSISHDITERKRAELDLRKSEERFRSLIEATSQMVWRTDSQENPIENIDWNGITGFEFKAQGLPWYEMIHPDDRERVLRERSESVKHSAIFESEFRLVNVDGSYHYFSARGVPIFEGDKVVEWIGTMSDITGRKKAEEKLRESEERLNTVINNLSEGLIIADLDGHFIHWNRASLELHGFENEEKYIRPVLEISEILELSTLDGKILEFEDRVMPRILRGEVLNNVELKVRRKDIDWERIFSYGGAKVTDAYGKEIAFLTITDITDHKIAEESLRAEKNRLEKMAMASPSAIFSFRLSPDGRVSFPFSSPVMKDIYGFTSEELKKDGSLIFANIHPEDVEKVNESVAESARTMSVLQATYRYRHPERGEIWTEGACAPTLESDGSIIWHGIVNDITERKHSEQIILKLNETLEQKVIERTSELNAVNNELEAFSYSVSHDLRAPLRAMDGFSLALLEDYEDKLDEDGKNYIRRVRAASQNMAHLIDDLLKLSRVSRAELQKENIDLSGIVQDIAGRLKEQQPNRRISFKIEENLTAYGDERLIKVLLENLIGNAWKYTSKREDSEIVFGKTEQADKTVFFVRDNGAGFDMAYVNKLFTAFQRLHKARDFEGTGIGLATVQRIVHRHGGQVWAEGEIGAGAAFYFTF